MGKSNAANWAGRWARGGRPDPLLGSVPDRASNPKRRPSNNVTCWSCKEKIDVENEGYHLVDGSPTCPSCMNESERGER